MKIHKTSRWKLKLRIFLKRDFFRHPMATSRLCKMPYLAENIATASKRISGKRMASMEKVP